jgi:CheY-like chemotaxis protein
MPFSSVPRVLIVDDYPEGARVMGRLLQTFGYQVTIAHSGRAALEIAKAENPHAILLDLILPDIDGFEVARHLRDEPSTRSALIIALSGWSLDDLRKRPGAERFNHLLLKPVAPSELRELLLRELTRPGAAFDALVPTTAQ